MFIVREPFRNLSSVGAERAMFRSCGALNDIKVLAGYKHFAPSGAQSCRSHFCCVARAKPNALFAKLLILQKYFRISGLKENQTHFL